MTDFRLPFGDEWEKFDYEEIDKHSGYVTFLFNTHESLILYITKRIVDLYFKDVVCVEIFVSKSKKYVGVKPAKKGMLLSRKQGGGGQISFVSVQKTFDLSVPVGKHITPVWSYSHQMLVIPLF